MEAKKEIRIAFRRMWTPWNMQHFKDRFRMIEHKYTFVEDNKNPEYVLYSVFGDEPLPKNAVKIFYTGENVCPNMDEADWAISFNRNIQSDRHMRVPNYVLTYNHIGMWIGDLTDVRHPGKKRQKFCAFLHNRDIPHRNEFVKKLSQYRQVDCAGRTCMANTVNPYQGKLKMREAKIEFTRDYMFCMAFENEIGNGYVTEKITDAFMAGCIPVYWGDPLVTKDFNPRAFINGANKSQREVIEEMKYVWESPDAYRGYVTQPPFRDNVLPKWCRDGEIVRFFRGIFG